MAAKQDSFSRKSHRLGRVGPRVRLRSCFILPPSIAPSNTPMGEISQRCFFSVEPGEREKKRMKKKTKLTIETERVLVIRRGSVGRRAACGACGEVVGLLTADEAAALLRVSPRAIYRQVEGGRVHFTETPDGALLICLNSLRD